MIDEYKKQDSFSQNVSVGWFLAKKEILRSNIWTTLLIIAVMTLTFLNLVVVSGILVGLIEGSEEAYKKYSIGDVIVSPFLSRSAIIQTPEVIEIVKTIPGYKNHSVKYTGSAQIESEYKKTVKPGENKSSAGAQILGINPEEENKFSNLSGLVIRGSYLENDDGDSILIGKNLLFEFTPVEAPGFQALKNVEVGSRIKVTSGKNSKEYFIKGIIGAKVQDFDSSIIMIESEARKISNRSDLDASTISVRLEEGADSLIAKNFLINSGVGEYGRVQTAEEAFPKFLQDIKGTFNILGSAISAIGLVVASITIFIVIFVNAITRRRYIGILKGIGVNKKAVLYSYIYQAVLYAFCGIFIGMVLVFVFIKPYFIENPIDFPFSDGILVATFFDSMFRAGILMVTTMLAGYIPANMVIKQNTLSAILGR